MQQTPCAQKPNAHSVPSVHAVPRAFLPQTPSTQLMPLEHTLLSTQDVRHFVPLSSHRNGEQSCCVPGVQVPSAAQRDASMIC